MIEKDPEYVGGISRTVNLQGLSLRHRRPPVLFQVAEVEELWDEILPDDMLVRPRFSRIFYNGKFFSYPLKAVEAFGNLGLVTSAACVALLFQSASLPDQTREISEDWVSNQFGERLFPIFFKTYTEKVWGMSLPRDLRGLGGAADQGALSRGASTRSARSQKCSRGQAVGRQDVDQSPFAIRGSGPG